MQFQRVHGLWILWARIPKQFIFSLGQQKAKAQRGSQTCQPYSYNKVRTHNFWLAIQCFFHFTTLSVSTFFFYWNIIEHSRYSQDTFLLVNWLTQWWSLKLWALYFLPCFFHFFFLGAQEITWQETAPCLKPAQNTKKGQRSSSHGLREDKVRVRAVGLKHVSKSSTTGTKKSSLLFPLKWPLA